MLKIQQVADLNDTTYSKLLEFVECFITGSGEDFTVNDAMKQIFADTPSRLWLIYEDEILKGYMFAEFSRCIEGDFTAVHQLFMHKVKDRTVYNHLSDALWDFNRQFGSRKLVCSTRHNPQAFLRLMKNGWKIDSYLLSSTR